MRLPGDLDAERNPKSAAFGFRSALTLIVAFHPEAVRP